MVRVLHALLTVPPGETADVYDVYEESGVSPYCVTRVADRLTRHGWLSAPEQDEDREWPERRYVVTDCGRARILAELEQPVRWMRRMKL
jgi:DNA-binding PadR family transcriptional regulator